METDVMECNDYNDEVTDTETDDESTESDESDESSRTVFYVKGKNAAPFHEWMNAFLPSSVNSNEDGIEWVYVYRPGLPFEKEHEQEKDVDGLMLSWEQILQSGRPITFQTILELAGNHHITYGKWMLFAQTGVKIDLLWQKVANAIICESSPIICNAKVSTYHSEGDQRHVVCIYNNDFRNKAQVLELEHALRNIGIKCTLRYKPDIYTYIGVYKRNPWGFRPTIFESVYDLKTGKSIITSDVFEI